MTKADWNSEKLSIRSIIIYNTVKSEWI